MKKAVSLLCLLAVFTAAVAGCNNNNNNSTTSAPAATNAAQPAETTVDEMAMTGNLFKKGVWAAKKDGTIASYFIFTDESNGRMEDADGMGGVPFTCEQNGIEVMFHFGDPDDNTKATFSLGDTTGVFDYGEGNTVTYEFMYLPDADADTFTVEAPVIPEGGEPAAAETVDEVGDRVYTVSVVNVLGAPVAGVNVQFCSAEECIFGTTDINGLAVFEVPEGKYDTHLFKVPDGYDKDETIYEVPEKYGMIQIVLKNSDDVEEKAADEEEFSLAEQNWSSAGLLYSAKGAYKDMKGVLVPMQAGYITVNQPIIWCTEMCYVGIDAADAVAFFSYINDDSHPEAPKPGWDNWKNLLGHGFTVYAIETEYGKTELENTIEEMSGMDAPELEEIGTADNITFFIAAESEEIKDPDLIKDRMDPNFFDEYKKLMESKQDFIDSLTFVIPEYPETANPGDVVYFETCDLDGNPVKSSDIFKDYKVTMINLWGTYCPPCRNELPEIEELSKKFKEKGVQIIGVCADATSLETMEAAKSILKEKGCTYPCYAAFDGMDDILIAPGLPATFFVDSNGKMLTDSIVGAYVAQYEPAVDAALEALEAGTAAE